MVVVGAVRLGDRAEVEGVAAGVEDGGVPVRGVHGVHHTRVRRLRAPAEPGGEAERSSAEFGRPVRESGGAVGELELAALAFLCVLDVGEQEARPVGGVGDDAVAQRDPDVGAVAAAQAQLGPAALAEVRSRVPMSSGWTRSEKA